MEPGNGKEVHHPGAPVNLLVFRCDLLLCPEQHPLQERGLAVRQPFLDSPLNPEAGLGGRAEQEIPEILLPRPEDERQIPGLQPAKNTAARQVFPVIEIPRVRRPGREIESSPEHYPVSGQQFFGKACRARRLRHPFPAGGGRRVKNGLNFYRGPPDLPAEFDNRVLEYEDRPVRVNYRPPCNGPSKFDIVAQEGFQIGGKDNPVELRPGAACRTEAAEKKKRSFPPSPPEAPGCGN